MSAMDIVNRPQQAHRAVRPCKNKMTWICDQHVAQLWLSLLEKWNREHKISTSCLHSRAIISPTIPTVPFCKANAKPHMNKI